MRFENVIVSYSAIKAAVSTGLESVEAGYDEVKSEVEITRAEMAGALSHALQKLENEPGIDCVMTSPRDRTACLLQCFLAREAAREGKLKSGAAGAFEVTFDADDWIGWAGSFFRWWKQLSPAKFKDWNGWIDSLPNHTRIAVLSDWGTGLYGAPCCSESIRNDQEGVALIMHLGDIYYAGDEAEVESRFLRFWPQVSGAINRSLNGNHEMYTGGNAYFQKVLPAFEQPSSFVVAQTDHWNLIGLDTAYDANNLGRQIAWMRRILEESDDRRTILFSHHQPFSILAGQGIEMVKALAPLLDDRLITAWFWGHEHHCILYDNHPLWGFRGRCVGHSGFPEFRPGVLGDAPGTLGWKRLGGRNLVPDAVMLDGPNQHVQGYENHYMPHGYTVLELEGPRVTELYYEADGTLLKRGSLA